MAESKDKNNNIQEEKPEEATKETEEIQAKQTDTGSDSDDAEKEVKPEGKVMKFIKSILPSVGIAIGSILFVYLLHYFGAFNTLELKLYDLRMKLRGPISGTESNSALPQAEGFIDLNEPFNDTNKNGIWDDSEIFTDTNENNQYDIGEQLLDCGQDGLCPGDEGYIGIDPGEGNGLLFIDTNELDDVFDTGDNCFGCIAEPYNDLNEQ